MSDTPTNDTLAGAPQEHSPGLPARVESHEDIHANDHLALGSDARGVQVQAVFIVGSTKVLISSGSVVNFNGDAIVNAANTGGVSGMGLDEAIAKAGGPELLAARKALLVISGSQRSGTRIEMGDAKVTIGGNLPAKWVIHAVGPNFSVAPQTPDKLLYRAYKATLEQAASCNISSIAFSMLSAGLFRGNRTLETLVEIACLAIKENLYDGLCEVHLVAFRETELRALMRIAPAIFGEQ